MAEDWDLFGWQTDAWGVTRYSLVIHAPADLTDRILAFRREIGLGDLTSEPHVSLIASMHQPMDLEVLKAAIRQTALALGPLRLDFPPGEVTHRETGGSLPIVRTPDLLTFRQALVEAVKGHIQLTNPEKPFSPHVTLYQMAGATEAEAARRIAPDHDFGDGFNAHRIDLVGRVGPPRGGTREVIAEFDLGAGTAS